jgi:hypothetical protein
MSLPCGTRRTFSQAEGWKAPARDQPVASVIGCRNTASEHHGADGDGTGAEAPARVVEEV